MSIVGKWGHSGDGEIYEGAFDTPEEAEEEAREDDHRYIGKYRAPADPLSFIDGDDVIERIICQDDYCGEWAEDCFGCTDEQLAELTQSLRSAFSAWMAKYSLEPTFGIVVEYRELQEEASP